MANLDLVRWDSPGDTKLVRCVQANAILNESAEKGIEVNVDSQDPELRDILTHKLKSYGLRQQPPPQAMGKVGGGPMPTIREAPAEESPPTRPQSQSKSVAAAEPAMRYEEKPVAPENAQTGTGNKWKQNWFSKMLSEEAKGLLSPDPTQVLQLVIRTVAGMEQELVKQGGDAAVSDVEKRIADLEAKVEGLSSVGQPRLHEGESEDVKAIIEGWREEARLNLEEAKRAADGTDLAQKMRALEAELGACKTKIQESYQRNAKELDKRIQQVLDDGGVKAKLKSMECDIAGVRQEVSVAKLNVAELSRKLTTDLQKSLETLRKAQEQMQMQPQPAPEFVEPLDTGSTDAGIRRLAGEVEVLKQKQLMVQHKLREIEAGFSESAKLTKLSMENLALQLKNVELLRAPVAVTAEKKTVQPPSKPAGTFLQKRKADLDAGMRTLENRAPLPAQLSSPTNKSVVVESKADTSFLLRTSPNVQKMAAIGAGPGPSKELLEFLKNRGFQFGNP